MTERNLSNGWLEAKRVRQFLFLLLLLNIVVWALNAAAYRNSLETASTAVKYMHLYDSEELFTVYDIVKGQVDVPGVVCMAFGMLCIAVVTVHRESFTENWHVTLRRIPNYRGKYLGSKLCAVLVPGGVYMVYTLTQGLFRWLMYKGDDTVRLFENTKTTMGDFLSFGPCWELVLLIVLAAQAMLLGSVFLPVADFGGRRKDSYGSRNKGKRFGGICVFYGNEYNGGTDTLEWRRSSCCVV